MKKISLILLVIMVFFCFSVSAVAEDAEYIDLLRVGISYGSEAKGEAWFYSESEIYVTDAYYGTYIATLPAYTKCKIYTDGGTIASDYFSPVGSAITLSGESVINFNDTAYRGSFELHNSSDKITVINIVNTDDYLASLLGKEMSANWPLEALKAQAVCARNYAMTIAGKHTSSGFDICDTQHCQVYGGVKSEADSTRLAVEETRGVTVTYEDEIVPLYYFSCDGGYTEDSENVWVTALGYLRGKKDIHEKEEYATRYNWSVTYTKAEIENILNSKNMGVGELCDIRIDEMSDNNGVIKLTFVGTLGEKTVTKTQTRTVLSLNSQAYTIEKNTNAPIISEEPEIVTQNILTADGVVTVTNPGFAMTGEGVKQIPYGTVTVQEESEYFDSYTFNGHGWGHLVGMSQWGAFSMAVEGYTYKDILNFYFTDIAIVEAPLDIYEETEPPVYEDVDVPVYEEPENIETEPWQDTTYEETQWSDTGI
ncbi:MAG: SpoIID/LytB domain-containing protein [Clostridia bacterium]|nr:SpoIID/LytB domain-containing protein [Clostridia bacterium]